VCARRSTSWQVAFRALVWRMLRTVWSWRPAGTTAGSAPLGTVPPDPRVPRVSSPSSNPQCVRHAAPAGGSPSARWFGGHCEVCGPGGQQAPRLRALHWGKRTLTRARHALESKQASHSVHGVWRQLARHLPRASLASAAICSVSSLGAWSALVQIGEPNSSSDSTLKPDAVACASHLRSVDRDAHLRLSSRLVTVPAPAWRVLRSASDRLLARGWLAKFI
jgi:hypothetical protein